jgi:uncharacterized protein (DUF1697 family)
MKAAAIFMIRGINVSGHRRLKMALLTTLCGRLGFTGMRTYLQSGNMVRTVPRSGVRAQARALEDLIAQECGFEAPVAGKSGAEMAAASGAARTRGGRPAARWPWPGRPCEDVRG